MDYVKAFWVGGLICAFVQILLDRTKLMPGRIMVLLLWCKRSGRKRWRDRDLHGRIQSQRSWNRSRADLWISGIMGIRATDEEIRFPNNPNP